MFILQQTVTPVGPRILSDDQRGDTTNTGRVFQHQAGGAQPAAPVQPPPIGQGPPAGPRPGDGFVPAVGPAGQNQDPNALAVINLLKSILRAVGPDGTYTAPDGTQISVQSILNDPANRAHIGELNSVIEIANSQRADLQNRILTRMIEVHDEINAGTHNARVEATIRKLAGDPQNGIQPEYGLRQNQEDPRFLDLIDANGQIVFGRVFQGTMQDIQNDPSKIQLLARTIILKEEELTVISNFDQETTRGRTREAPLLSIADLRQIRQNVNNDQRIKDRNLRLPDSPPTVSDDAASEAVWRSIQTLQLVRQWPALVKAMPWLAKVPLLGRCFNGMSAAGQWLGATRAVTWLGTATRAIPLVGKPLAWCGARAIPGLNIAFLAADNLIDWGTAFHSGKGSDYARAGINTGFTVAGAALGCWIPVVGPVLGAIVGNLVGKAVSWLVLDGGAKKIWNFCKEHIPAITKPLEIIAKPFVKAWKAIFG